MQSTAQEIVRVLHPNRAPQGARVQGRTQMTGAKATCPCSQLDSMLNQATVQAVCDQGGTKGVGR
jgi:hypothetical protein